MNTSEAWSYYAQRPLDNKLINETVSVREYESGTGLANEVTRAYQAVDTELWAQSFLEAVEQFIGIFFSSADNRLVHPDVARVLNAKTDLSKAIPKGIAALFTTSTVNEDQIAAARNAVKTALQKSLSNGYKVATILVGKDNSVELFTPGKSAALPHDGIPAPLRSFPRLPTLLTQTCLPTYPEATNTGEAKLYDYAFRFSCESGYRDSLYISFDKAVYPTSNTAASTGLFACLAQFMEVWPGLQKDFPEKYDPVTAQNNAMSIAMKTFSGLAEQVADAWAGYWDNHSNQPQNTPVNSYILTKKYRLGNPALLDVVYLSIPQQADPVLPLIVIYDTVGNLRQLTASKVNDAKWMYSPGNAIDSYSEEFEFTFTGNDLFSTTPFYPELCLLRNNFDHIDPQFVFVTGQVAFPDVEIPAIEQYETITLDSSVTRVAALNTFFTQLLPANTSLLMKIELSFVMQNEGLPPVILPLFLVPDNVYSESMVNSIDEQLSAWQAEHKDVKGDFSMALTVFDAKRFPILRLHEVRFQ